MIIQYPTPQDNPDALGLVRVTIARRFILDAASSTDGPSPAMTTISEPPQTIDYSKHPRPRRSLRLLWRLFMAGLILVLLVAIAWVVFMVYINRQLNGKIASLHSQGVPVWPSDLARPEVNDAENAAIPLGRAMVMAKISQAQFDALTKAGDADEFPLNDGERAALGAIVSANQQAIDLAHEARGRNKARWDLDPASVLSMQPTMLIPSEFNQVRELCNVLRNAALLAHDRGDDQAAMDRVLDLERLADATDQLTPTLVCHLVSFAIHATGEEIAMRVVPDLAIASSSTSTSPAARPASPRQVRQLIDTLLDDREYANTWKNAMNGERVLGMQMLKTTTGGPGRLGYWQLNAIQLLDWYTPVSSAATQPSLRAAQQSVAGATSAPTSGGSMLLSGSLLTKIVGPSLGRAIVVHYRGVTDRRLAATALAIRQYALDHGGRLPTTLPDLVPQYLPAVPADPLANDSAPLQFRPTATPPVLYSVGEDAVDDGGSTKVMRGGREVPADDPAAGSQWMMQDEVVFLTRQPRRPPPSAPTTHPD